MAPVKISYIVSFSSQVSRVFPQGGLGGRFVKVRFLSELLKEEGGSVWGVGGCSPTAVLVRHRLKGTN